MSGTEDSVTSMFMLAIGFVPTLRENSDDNLHSKAGAYHVLWTNCFEFRNGTSEVECRTEKCILYYISCLHSVIVQLMNSM